MKEKIRLSDKNGIDIHVDDILYWSDKDTYFTVFEVPGGYAIESNPRSFGLYDQNDPFPVYESTGDAQTASFISSNLEVIGDIYMNSELYNKIKDEYRAFKENWKTFRTKGN